MSQLSTQDPEFAIREEAGSRPVNRIALLTILLGPLSPLALIHPLFAVISVAVFLLAAIALRTMPAVQSGRTLVLIAIVLASLFGSWGPARYFSRQRILFGHAQQFVDQWFALIANGNRMEAHELTFPFENRHDFNDLDSFYEPPPKDGPGPGMGGPTPYVQMTTFFERRPLKDMQQMPGGFNYQFVKGLTLLSAPQNRQRLKLLYRITPREGRPSEGLDVVVFLFRRPGQPAALWWVSDIALFQPADKNFAKPRTW